jgi:xylan 1,4-beta-xylosidase
LGWQKLQQLKKEFVKVQLDNIKKVKSFFIKRIDDNHANARKAWIDMGSPECLTTNEVSALKLASTVIMESLSTRQEKNSIFVKTTVLPQGLACITIETE